MNWNLRYAQLLLNCVISCGQRLTSYSAILWYCSDDCLATCCWRGIALTATKYLLNLSAFIYVLYIHRFSV